MRASLRRGWTPYLRVAGRWPPALPVGPSVTTVLAGNELRCSCLSAGTSLQAQAWALQQAPLTAPAMPVLLASSFQRAAAPPPAVGRGLQKCLAKVCKSASQSHKRALTRHNLWRAAAPAPAAAAPRAAPVWLAEASNKAATRSRAAPNRAPGAAAAAPPALAAGRGIGSRQALASGTRAGAGPARPRRSPGRRAAPRAALLDDIEERWVAGPASAGPAPGPAGRACEPARADAKPGGALPAASPSAPARNAGAAALPGPAPLPSIPEAAEAPLQEPSGAPLQAPTGPAGGAEAGRVPGSTACGRAGSAGGGLLGAPGHDHEGYSFPALLSGEGGCPSPDPIPNPALGAPSTQAQPQPRGAAEAAPGRVTRSATQQNPVAGPAAVSTMPSEAAACPAPPPALRPAPQGGAGAAQLPGAGAPAERGLALGRDTRSPASGAGLRPASASGACGVDAAWGAVGSLLEHMQAACAARGGAPPAEEPGDGAPDPGQELCAPAAACGSPAAEAGRARMGQPRGRPRSAARALAGLTPRLGNRGSASTPTRQDGQPAPAVPGAAERACKQSSGGRRLLRELGMLALGSAPGLPGACSGARTTRQGSRAGPAIGALPASGPAVAAGQPPQGHAGKGTPLSREGATLRAGREGHATEGEHQPAAPVTRKRARTAAAAGRAASPGARAGPAANPAEGRAAKRARRAQDWAAGPRATRMRLRSTAPDTAAMQRQRRLESLQARCDTHLVA